MSTDDFTPEERAQLKAMLARLNADAASIKFATNAPPNGRLHGRIGRFSVFLNCTATVLGVLLIPDAMAEAARYYGPAVIVTYSLLGEAISQSSEPAQPDDFPPTQLRISTSATTTTPPPGAGWGWKNGGWQPAQAGR
jgi:hypothetical protein